MKNKAITSLFLIIEAILYYIIMTKGGRLLVWSSFIAIVLCFAFVLINVKKADKYILFALGFTVCADYFVLANPVNQLCGMLFFLVVQTLYSIMLHKMKEAHSPRTNKAFMISRLCVCAFGILICLLVLKENVDSLSIVSVYYYVNLIFNIILSLSMGKKTAFFSVGLILFLLCDTVIGLQVAANGYLPIQKGSLIHSIIFTDFFLSWFFYLPSQVIIALKGARKHI